MTFLLSAKVANKYGDVGDAWWISRIPLTPDNLIQLIENRKEAEDLGSIVPIFIYDFGDDNERD